MDDRDFSSNIENDELNAASAPVIFWGVVVTLTGSLVCCGFWAWLILFRP